MNPPSSILPPGVRDALDRGNLIEAIKLLRTSGIGLKEAKDAVQAHMGGQPVAAPKSTPARGFAAVTGFQTLPPDVTAALQRGEKIEAIRLMREQTGLGLKEAKEAVDNHGGMPMSGLNGLSPGQVGDTGSGIWWVVGLILVCLVGYMILRRLT